MVFGRDRAIRRSVARIADFWTWWSAQGRAAALETLDGHGPAAFARAITPRVKAIDDRLTWHTEPGVTRPHRLVLSAAGEIEARATAERWRRAAPADDLWEFAASTNGDAATSGAVLGYAGRELQVDDVRFVTTELSKVIDVTVEHPAFAAIPDQTRAELSFLLLDLVLGEDDMERYIGHIDHAGHVSGSGVTAAELLTAVRRIHDDDSWVLARATHEDGSQSVLQIAPQLHPLDHLPFDRHTAVELRYEARQDGLADSDELHRVQQEQSRLEAALGGSAVTVLEEMHGGVRTVHLYSDGADRNAMDTIDRLARGRRDVRVRHQHDPRWRQVADYRRL